MAADDVRPDRPTSDDRVRLLMVGFDVGAVVVSLGGAYLLRYHTGLAERVPSPGLGNLVDMWSFLGLFTAVGLQLLGTGRVRHMWRPVELACSVALAAVVAVILFSAMSLITARFFHRLFTVYFAILVVPTVVAGRYAVHRFVARRYASGRGLRERRLVFIGDSPLMEAIMRQVDLHPELGYRVVDIVPMVAMAEPASMQKALEMLRDGSADQLLLASAPGSYQDLVELVAVFRGPGAGLKRALDLSVSVLGVVIGFPVFLAIAAAIKLDSPGPVFFRRRCLGRAGAPFDVLKFRSMVRDAHAVLEHTPEFLEEYRRTLKVKHDPRITRVGRFLRRTSLDEIPQLFNVVAGHMSLVGPRMLGDIELERYGNFRDKVLSIRPGITGLWQVSGRSRTSFEERLALDNEYIDRWSIGLDLRILVKTIPVVLRMRGAE